MGLPQYASIAMRIVSDTGMDVTFVTAPCGWTRWHCDSVLSRLGFEWPVGLQCEAAGAV